jgi:hypothetical protein
MKKLFLLTTILLSFQLHAQDLPASCFNEDGEFNETCWTDPTCKRPGEKIEGDAVCCQGLQANSASICDEPALTDPALVSCASQADCSGGTGCMVQRGQDLFSILSPNSSNPDVLDDKRDIVASQMSDADVNKPAGGSCTHARDCLSYSCAGGSCENKMVCRFADIGETPGPGVNCGTGLVKNAQGACDLSAEAKNVVYTGLITNTTLRTVGQCQIQLDEDTVEKAKIAMANLRAMEWFFSTISVPEDEECFKVLPVIKDQVGKTLFTTRKNILKNFTDILNGIDFDYKQLMEAQEGSTKMLTIHNGEQIKEGDLATRLTSGYDSLMMMYRRNLLFQSLENNMLESVKGADVGIKALSTGMATWKDGDTSWKIGDQVISSYNCEGSKYKKKGFLSGWKTKYYKKIKDRWAIYYEVTGSAAGNADVVKRETVAKNLGLIYGSTPEEAVGKFTAGKYYMMDPMMFGGLNNKGYGSKKKLKSKSSFLGLFGGFKDLRKAFTLNGSGNGSLTAIYNDLKPKVRDYFKSLKLDPAQKTFVYEPELFATEAKDCLDGGASEQCNGFDAFMDTILDGGFAQFLAWSQHNKDSYEGFFPSAVTYRRKLLTKLEVDLQNLMTYYDAVSKLRDEQNTCIEKVINGIIQDGILVGGSGGIVEDDHGPEVAGSVSPTTLTPGSLNSLAVSSSPLGLAPLSPLSRAQFSFDLSGSTPTMLSTKSNLSGSGSSGKQLTGSAANLSASANGSQAARKNDMLNANGRAQKAGVDVSSKESKVNAIIDSMNGSGGSSSSSFGSSAGAGGGLSSGSSSNSKLGSNALAALSPDASKKSDQDKAAADAKAAAAAAMRKITFGAGSGGDGTGRNSTQGKTTDALSDSDKETVLENYQRTRSDYEGSDADDLFEKVSKAYVRNLDRILIRKRMEE